jgi:hypothetical protein
MYKMIYLRIFINTFLTHFFYYVYNIYDIMVLKFYIIYSLQVTHAVNECILYILNIILCMIYTYYNDLNCNKV